jgi:hypothetical protein
MRNRVGQTLLPVWRQMRDSWMLRVHQDLGEQASTHAFDEGLQLSLEEALALAHAGDASTLTGDASAAPALKRGLETQPTQAAERTEWPAGLTSREVEVL